ncbi:MAG: hypothetical protein LBE56_00300 [Tannerella sp.]|jgi:hypothetical protein|nr:hypothetical protein [Tannerella sp.]
MRHLFIFYFGLFFIFVVNGQEKAKWDFPVKPGTEEWKKFSSVAEMYATCQIPEEVLNQLDTESLMELCLNFPAPPLFPLFNSPEQAFLEYYSHFNGIKELFKRKDVGECLLRKYTSMNMNDFSFLWPLHEQGRFVSKYKFIEAILSQPQVISSFDGNVRKELLKEAVRKMDEKIEKKDVFGGFSLEINLWTIVNLLSRENEAVLQGHNQQNLRTAMETGLMIDIDADMLYQQAKNFVNEKE